MNFVQFFKALDDLFYEIVTWLVFYPITLWGVLRRPWAMMDYARAELNDKAEQQYTDTLSPPIFLLLTLLLSHGIELALVGQNPLVTGTKGLAALIPDDTTLLLVRMVFFSVFPLVMSVRLLRRQYVKLTRNSLKRPFYAQCYPAAVFALLLGLGVMTIHLHRGPAVDGIGWLVVAAALLWYGTLQTGWFKRTLGISWWRGFLHATIGMVECLLMIVVIVPLIA